MFAGDVGSISMALILLFVGILFFLKLESPLILLFFIVYGADSILTLLYRKISKKRITEAHREHIYQKLVDVKKYSHIKVSFIYSFIQLIIILLIINFGINRDINTQYLILLSLCIIFTSIYILLFKQIEKLKNVANIEKE